MRCFLCGLGDRLCGLDDLVLCGSRVAGSWEAVVGSGSVLGMAGYGCSLLFLVYCMDRLRDWVAWLWGVMCWNFVCPSGRCQVVVHVLCLSLIILREYFGGVC